MRGDMPPVGPVVTPAGEKEEVFDGRAVLVGHEVVEDWVNWGAQVEEHHGGHVEVLTEAGRVVVINVSEEEPTDVVRQPAYGKDQYNNS